MKYWLALPLIVFSGCGLATLQCEGGFLGEIDDAALVQKIAKQSLEEGHFWANEIVSRRSDDLKAV